MCPSDKKYTLQPFQDWVRQTEHIFFQPQIVSAQNVAHAFLGWDLMFKSDKLIPWKKFLTVFFSERH